VKTIKIYNTSLSQIGVITNYASFQPVNQLRGIGSFSLRIAAKKKGIDLLQEGNLLELEGSTMIILSRNDTDEADGSFVTISGHSALELLNRRTAVAFAATDKTETLAKQVVEDNIVAPLDGDRALANTQLSPDQGRGSTQALSIADEPLIKPLETLLAIDGYGHKISLAAGNKLEYEVIVGTDRSASVQFSANLHNLKNSSRQRSRSNYKNVVYIDGDGVSATVGSATGFDRREVYIKNNKISSTLDLTDRANQELAGRYFEADTIQARIRLASALFVYGVDYFLGDIVSVVSGGTVYELQITQVTQSYSEQGEDLVVDFGIPVRSSAEQITDIRKDIIDAAGGSVAGGYNFTELGEVPASFSGQAGKLLAVNAGESAVEFVAASIAVALADLSSVGNSANQVIPLTASTFYTVGSGFTIDEANNRIIANFTGKLILDGNIFWRLYYTDPDMTFSIRRNGSTIKQFILNYDADETDDWRGFTYGCDVTAGQYIDLHVITDIDSQILGGSLRVMRTE